MAQVVNNERANPAVKQLAFALTNGCAVGNRACYYESIRKGLSFRFRFMEDGTGIEEVCAPSVSSLRISHDGFAYGDCDCYSVLAAALARARGLDARFVAQANGRSGRRFNHVFVQVNIDGNWLPLDVSPQPGIRYTIWRI